MENGRGSILIASSSLDSATHEPVRQRLLSRGYPVVTYQTDQVLAEREEFCLTIEPQGGLRVTYDGHDIAPRMISAAWFWKVTSFRSPDAETNVAKQLSLVNEITQAQQAIWWLYPEAIWINSPSRTHRANLKLEQLLVAQSVGFSVPYTVVTNDWSAIAPLVANGEEAIVKMCRGVLADQNTLKAMYTTRLTAELLGRLRKEAVAFPGIYQPFLDKRREWRVTVVGSRVFPAAIYTSDRAKDDWRRLQVDPDAVSVRAEPLDSHVEARCVEYLVRMNLRYGAFDLVERESGEIVFLECNPSGQFMWLEDGLGDRIADAIADELITIYDKNQIQEGR